MLRRFSRTTAKISQPIRPAYRLSKFSFTNRSIYSLDDDTIIKGTRQMHKQFDLSLREVKNILNPYLNGEIHEPSQIVKNEIQTICEKINKNEASKLYLEFIRNCDFKYGDHTIEITKLSNKHNIQGYELFYYMYKNSGGNMDQLTFRKARELVVCGEGYIDSYKGKEIRAHFRMKHDDRQFLPRFEFDRQHSNGCMYTSIIDLLNDRMFAHGIAVKN
jgi:hypothetical protein